MEKPKTYPRVILLLGSYDPRTRRILLELKERLSRGLVSLEETVLVLLLEDVEIYKAEAEGNEMTVIAERYDDRASLFIFSGSSIIDATDLSIANDIDTTTKDYLVTNHGARTLMKLPLLEKLRHLSFSTSLVFLVRHHSLTRGGEYIELVYLLGSEGRMDPSKMYFFKREGIDLSEMVREILNRFGTNFRSYKDKDDLCDEAIRVAKYSFLRQ